MCGIFGYLSFDNFSLNKDVLNSMATSIKHRGPDAFGIYNAEGVAIGNQRLSIIDVEGGNQPFISEDNQIIVVQNGEIFNHLELREILKKNRITCSSNCDTEVILKMYELYGLDCIQYFNGMFAIAIYDKRKSKLFLIRDRLGIKPLYYFLRDKTIIFGSEIKSILKSNIAKPKVSEEAIFHYLKYNFVPPPLTIYNNIYHLNPASYIEFSRGKHLIREWWDLSSINLNNTKKESNWIEEFNYLLSDSVSLRMRCDVPYGAFLSGGVDSSSIVGLMSKKINTKVKTYSIGFNEKKYDETKFAKEAAARFNTNHIANKVDLDLLENWDKVLYFCDQPHGDISFLPTFKVSEIASKEVKVVLTGDGGDELFGGYDKYLNFLNSNQEIKKIKERNKLYLRSTSLFPNQDLSKILSNAGKKLFNKFDFAIPAKKIFEKVSHQDNINQMLYLDVKLLLPGNNLVKPDRMGMANSLEARTPFLDYRLVELAFQMPGSLKIKNGISKFILKKAVRKLIGDNLAYRKKQMFTVPVGEWFKDEKYKYCLDKINKLGVYSNLFNTKTIVKMLEDHSKGIYNYTRELRALVSLSIWFENYHSI